MNLKGKAAAIITAAVLASNFILPSMSVAFAAGSLNENFDSGNGLSNFITSLGGGIKIEGDTDNNHYMNISPVTDGITAFAQYNITSGEGVNLDIGMDFMQNQKKQDGADIINLTNDGHSIMRIFTAEGNIVMQRANSNINIVLIKNHIANHWYHISASVDFINGLINIYIDGGIAAEEIGMLIAASSADALYMSTRYSPGFRVDNISVVPQQNITGITLNGESQITVGTGKNAQYTYSADVYDQNGKKITDAVHFSLFPENEGITMSQNGDTATLTVDDSASGKTFELKAQAGNLTESKSISVTHYDSVLTSMQINGEAKLSSRTSRRYRYKYDSVFYDQYGEVMDNEDCTYSLTGSVPSALQLDSDTGEITVTGELPKDTHITLNAVSKTNSSVKAQKQLTLLDAQTYASDAERFQTLLDYVDLVEELGKDDYNGTPLLALVYDRYAKQQGQWRSGTDAGHAVISDLAFQGGWFRTLHALYELTGDEHYKQEVDNTYQYYLDNYIDENSGTVYWGGHTAINLEKAKPYFIYNATYEELKDAGMYMGPFFDLSKEKSAEIVKNTICLHMVKWNSLMFNRHGVYGTVVDDSPWYDWKTWKNNVQSETFSPNSCIPSTDVSFRVSAADFLSMLGNMYKYTGDEAAKTWGMNILDGYYRVENPDTYIGGYQTSSARLAAYKAEPENWYTDGNYKNEYSYTSYGDRYYNQYADDLVDQGFLTEENKWQASECFTNWDSAMYSAIPIHEMQFAEDIGLDSKEGGYVLERNVKKLAKFIDIAYDADTNKAMYNLLSDGTRLDNFVIKRNGYYGTGNIGIHFKMSDIPTLQSLSYMLAYLKSENREDLQTYRDSIYYFLRNYFLAIGAGDIGESKPGDNMNLNMSCDLSDGYQCMVMTYLYQATGITDFLDMARHIADNFIKEKMADGLFHINTSDVYIPLGSCKSERFHYALALLEATIRGEADTVPSYIPYDGYFEDKAYDELEKGYYDGTDGQIKDTNYFTGYSFENVRASQITLDSNDVTLNIGDTKYLEISVLPSDASYTLAYDNTNPSCVSVNYDNNSIYAVSRGTAYITVSNTDKTAKTVLKVTVE